MDGELMEWEIVKSRNGNVVHEKKTHDCYKKHTGCGSYLYVGN
jgi:hypothetical protein